MAGVEVRSELQPVEMPSAVLLDTCWWPKQKQTEIKVSNAVSSEMYGFVMDWLCFLGAFLQK